MAADVTGKPDVAAPRAGGRGRRAVFAVVAIGGLLLGAAVATVIEAQSHHQVTVSRRFNATVSMVSSSHRGICVVQEGSDHQFCGLPWIYLAAGTPRQGDKVQVIVENPGAPFPSGDSVFMLVPRGMSFNN